MSRACSTECHSLARLDPKSLSRVLPEVAPIANKQRSPITSASAYIVRFADKWHQHGTLTPARHPPRSECSFAQLPQRVQSSGGLAEAMHPQTQQAHHRSTRRGFLKRIPRPDQSTPGTSTSILSSDCGGGTGASAGATSAGSAPSAPAAAAAASPPSAAAGAGSGFGGGGFGVFTMGSHVSANAPNRNDVSANKKSRKQENTRARCIYWFGTLCTHR
jgi:hypothetical protein